MYFLLRREIRDVFFAQERDMRYILCRRVEERVGKAGDSDQGQPLHVEMEQMTNVMC